MSRPHQAESPPASPPPTRALASIRLAELEREVHRVRQERDEQALAIESELGRLSEIYQTLSSDLEAARAERDRAIEAAREERERRARETLDLSEKLDAAVGQGGAPASPQLTPESFVQLRLSNETPEYRPLKQGEMPCVPGYKVTAPLGQGGMATVYHAVTDREAREVAIKILHDGADSSKGRLELFLREAAVMLQLSHPGLVRAFDAGDCVHGRYLVMELVRGESLGALIRRCGPFPEKEALRIGLQVARALAYCARLGLTHRDVKPSNLLLDTTGRVRLCDFGLAALSFGNDPARPYGSPGYAAPEQISNPTSIDERVDIYALGCTLWHLVVGRRAFTGSAKEVFEIQRAQDLSDPRFEGADISPRLAQVIRRMGRAARDKRYRRWDECILDLMLVENGNPPFAAHLAEAQEPGSPAISNPAATPEPVPGVDERTVGSASQTVLPASLATGVTEVQLAPPSRTPSDALRRRAPVIFLWAIGLLGVAFGYALTTISRPTLVSEIANRALDMAHAGRVDEAVRLLRAAAPSMDQRDREELIRIAERLQTEQR